MIERLTSDIRQLSYWKILYVASYFLGLAILMILLDIPWWVSIVVTGIAITVVFLSEKLANQPLFINAPDLNNANTHWQLLYEGRNRQELWEANLCQGRRFGHCLQLSFQTVHPIATKKTVLIWQDQVNANTWRQLKIFIKWF